MISRYFIDCIVSFLNTTAKSPESQIEVRGGFGAPGVPKSGSTWSSDLALWISVMAYC